MATELIRNSTAFLFALDREAKPFRKLCPRAWTIITGVGIERAAAVAQSIAKERPRAIISAGFAGALHQGLAIGDVLIATEVVDAATGEVFKTVGSPQRKQGIPLLALRAPVRVLTSSSIIGDPVAKAHFGCRFHVDAVDMESSGVARVCAEHSIPVGCVRVISDALSTQLPAQLADLLTSGHVGWRQVLMALARTPGLISDFRRLARDTRFAAARLAESLAQFAAACD